jgi:ABC-type transport system involved in multi-copper enzyme maturation permease subunit
MLAAAAFTIVQTTQFVVQGRPDALGGLTAAELLLLLLHFGQVIPILLGAWVVGQDTPVGPRRSAFLATARRSTLIVGKYLTAAIAALVAGVVSCLAALLPLLLTGGAAGATVSLAPYGWLIGYWTMIAVVTAGLVAATRSVALAAVPVLIWTVGLSDLLAAQIPALAGALDQVFKSAYLGQGAAPSATALAAAGAQMVVALAIGSALYTRRDAR